MPTRCVEAMEAMRLETRGELRPDGTERLADHAQGCARCAAARADALALRETLQPPGPASGPMDPVAWERGLFLRLLREGDTDGRRRPGRWGRLALRLGRGPMREVAVTWRRWARDGAAGASR